MASAASALETTATSQITGIDLVEQMIRVAAGEGTTLEIAGGGTKRDIGQPFEADRTLSTVGLSGITEYNPAELVVTARAGTLGPAIAVHFFNNVVAIVIVSMPDSLSGLSLFLSPFSMTDAEEVRAWLPVDFAMMVVSWLAARLAGLGYPGFAYLRRSRAPSNPAEILLSALAVLLSSCSAHHYIVQSDQGTIHEALHFPVTALSSPR